MTTARERAEALFQQFGDTGFSGDAGAVGYNEFIEAVNVIRNEALEDAAKLDDADAAAYDEQALVFQKKGQPEDRWGFEARAEASRKRAARIRAMKEPT